jgi:hypothetical protein
MAAKRRGLAKLPPVIYTVIRLMVVLTASLALAGCKPEATPIAVSNIIAYGQSVRGQLGAHENRWIFVGTSGDLVVVEATTTDEMPLIAVIGPMTDSVGRVSPETGRLERFRLPITGQYTIVVGPGSGEYTLSLRLVSSADQTPTPLPTPSQIPISSNLIGVGGIPLRNIKNRRPVRHLGTKRERRRSHQYRHERRFRRDRSVTWAFCAGRVAAGKRRQLRRWAQCCDRRR